MSLEVRIASPCSADWNQMMGDDRVRFCPDCQRNVYNFSSMTEGEVKRLVSQSEGRLCGRFYQRRDGTMMVKNCSVGFRGSILRATRMATAALAAAVSANPIFAAPAANSGRGVPPLLLQIEAARPAISITVLDFTGAFIPNAEVSFRNSNTGETRDGKTDEEGTLRTSVLAKGKYQVTVRANGFRTEIIDDVEIPNSKPMKVTLEIETVMMGAVVSIRPEMEPDVAPLDMHLVAPPDLVAQPNPAALKAVQPNPVAPPSKLHRFFARIFQSL
jgi:hypothetical protein